MKTKYYVEGMTCAACSSHVEIAVRKINGVKNVSVNLLTTEMYVESDTKLDKKIENAVKKAGYKLVYEKQSEKVDHKKARIIVSIILGILLLYVSMGHMLKLPIPHFLHNKIISGLIELALTLPIVFLNFHYFVNGFKKLFRLSPNMDSLIAIGSTTSFIYSLVMLIKIIVDKDTSSMMHFYFDSASMILVLVSLGKYLESKSKSKTLDAITKLMKLSPKECIILVDGEEKEIQTKDVKENDIIICKQGMQVPIDGKIIEGNASLDESNITGESMPVNKEVGDGVISSSYVLSGYIKIKAVKVGDDTTINQIIRLVNEASNSKAPISKLADKVAGKFTYIVISIALVAFIVFLFLEGFSFALNIGISVLVVSCPCALGLATPVAIMVGTGVSAKRGILIKNAEVLENTCKIKTVVLDKTGTITYGKPSVIDNNNENSERALQIAYSLERLSDHPLAYAIKEKAEEKNIKPLEVENFETIEGVGVSGFIEGKKYYASNLRALGFDLLTKELVDGINQDGEKGISDVIISSEEEVLDVIRMTDEVRPTSKDAINNLHKLGIKVVMLTGDKKMIAKKIASQLSIDEVHSEVLPQDKQEIIKKIKKETNGLVAMTGDGVNDAIALTEADVGVSVGKGTDIAIDSSDIVLLYNDLNGLADIICLSKKVMRTIKINLFWAFFYNAIAISFASGLFYYSFNILMNPMLCALAMTLSSLFVTINSLSINLYKSKGVKNMSKLIITNMNCMHCVKRIEEALGKVKGLEFKVNLDEKSVTLETEDEKKVEKAKKMITKAGYEIQ